MGLISVAELKVGTVQDVDEILSLYQNEGFGFSDLMFRQAAIRSGGNDRQTLDHKVAKLAGVILTGISH